MIKRATEGKDDGGRKEAIPSIFVMERIDHVMGKTAIEAMEKIRSKTK